MNGRQTEDEIADGRRARNVEAGAERRKTMMRTERREINQRKSEQKKNGIEKVRQTKDNKGERKEGGAGESSMDRTQFSQPDY